MLDGYTTAHVTGGRGFIGRHLVAALTALGKEVVVVDLEPGEPEPPEGVRHVQADVRDRGEVERALAGAELLFHTAANANGTRSILDPRFDFETNSVGTLNVAQAAVSAGVRRMVYVSSASVYGVPRRFPMDEDHPTRPFVPYGATKLAGELTCLSFHATYGLPCVVGRPFCVYGPGENPETALVEISRYLRWHLRGEPINIVGDPDAKTRDFVHVRDLVAGLLAIADRAPEGEVYNVGSGEEHSMRGVVDLIGEVTGQLPLINEISGVTNDTYRLVADISKLRGLGYAPSVSLADGISDLVSRLGPHPDAPGGVTIFVPGQHAET